MTERYFNLEEYTWLMKEVLKHETEQAMALGALLHDRLQPKSVIDVGAGPGIYLVPFKERGCQVLAIDGCPAGGESVAPEEFQIVDLRAAWDPPQVFDLALCIEVGEHLHFEFHDTLVATLVKCAPLIYFSAARPGQGGEGHYGEATKEYWLEKFGQHGIHKHALSDQIQAHIHQDPIYRHCHWLDWNGMLLGRA